MKFAAIAPFVISTLSADRGFAVFAEYSDERFDLKAFEPRIEPYRSFVPRSMTGFDWPSDSFCRSLTDIEAAQVSAMLYLHFVS